MRARDADRHGYVDRDGIKVFYEVFGEGEPTLVLLPSNPIVHSRQWKAQVPYLSRHYRVVTFDGRGNGTPTGPLNPTPTATRRASPTWRRCWLPPVRNQRC